jgi:hypothetical protein
LSVQYEPTVKDDQLVVTASCQLENGFFKPSLVLLGHFPIERPSAQHKSITSLIAIVGVMSDGKVMRN